MNVNMNFRTLVTLAVLGGGAYFVYDLSSCRAERSEIARLRRIEKRYKSARDYETVYAALDNANTAVQALAVEILAENVERPALPKLQEMLGDGRRGSVVKEQLAAAMAKLGVNDAIPRLVELTDNAEDPSVRSAAHHALVRLTDSGAQVKLGDNTREQWENWLRSRRITGVR